MSNRNTYRTSLNDCFEIKSLAIFRKRRFGFTMQAEYGQVLIVHESSVFFLFVFANFFENTSKTAQTIFIKKKKRIGLNHSILVYKNP